MTKTLCSGGVIETIINKINKILFIICLFQLWFVVHNHLTALRA